MAITKLDQMLDLVKSKSKKVLIAAYANDAHTIEAVSNAIDRGIIDGVLVGDQETIKKVCQDEKIDINKFKQIVHEPNDIKATTKAVEMINKGEGQILMKGLVSTDKYMRAILNKETGLMGSSKVLSHVTVFETPNYPKLLVCSDVAIIPAPDLNQKIAITNFVINVAQALEIKNPKVSLIAATEQMSNMPACIDAAIIAKMADRGQIKGALVDGPLSLDLSLDQESVQIKGVKSTVAGDADCLVFPNIESGNVFYKTNTKLCGAELAAMVVGAKVPCVLSSRGDSVMTKLYSIALAALSAK